jgi:hypothetical protein
MQFSLCFYRHITQKIMKCLEIILLSWGNNHHNFLLNFLFTRKKAHARNFLWKIIISFPFLTLRSSSNDSIFHLSYFPKVMLKRFNFSFGTNFTFWNPTVESFPLKVLNLAFRLPIFFTCSVPPPATITSSFTDFQLIRLLSLQTV